MCSALLSSFLIVTWSRHCSIVQRAKNKEETQTERRNRGGDRWKGKMEGGKTNRESTHTHWAVPVSIAGEMHIGHEPLSTVLKQASLLLLHLLNMQPVLVCYYCTYPAQAQKWNISTLLHTSCEYCLCTSSHLIPSLHFMVIQSSSQLSVLFSETHRSPASQLSWGVLSAFPILTLIMPHTCAVLLSSKKSNSKQRMKSCSPLGCFRCHTETTRGWTHRFTQTDKQTERQVVSLAVSSVACPAVHYELQLAPVSGPNFN